MTWIQISGNTCRDGLVQSDKNALRNYLIVSIKYATKLFELFNMLKIDFNGLIDICLVALNPRDMIFA